MKTTLNLIFKRIGTFELFWNRRTWFRNWNLSGVVDTKLTIAKKQNKEHKEKAKADAEEAAQEAPVPLVTHVDNILHSIFSSFEVNINNQQIYNCNRFSAHKFYISNNFKGAISEYTGVLHCEGYDFEEFPDEIMEAPLSETFFTWRMKMLSRPDGFMLYGELGVDFFSTSKLLYPNMKIRLQLSRARSIFYLISDNPNVNLRIVDCSLYTPRLALRDDYHKKLMACLLTLVWNSTIWKLLQRFSSFLPDKTSSFKKTFSTMLQFVGLLLQWIQALHSLDLIVKIVSGINNLISDKIDYSEEVSQS